MSTVSLAGCVVALANPVFVGRAPGHHWFSTLHPFGGDRFVCEVVVADDKAQGQWPGVLYCSEDGGAAWRRALDIPSYSAVSVAHGADTRLLMPYETWPAAPGDKRNVQAPGTIIRWPVGGEITAEPLPVRFLGFPRDLAPYRSDGLMVVTNGNTLPLKDGRLFMAMYGKFAGDPKYSLMGMTTDDGGATWRFHGLVADTKTLPHVPEGPCESHTARLADGRLLCVYRVGSGRDWLYHKSLSGDEGLTWTAPEAMPDIWSVEPQLLRLENGLLVLSGGRPGLFLWVCADGEGKTWQAVNLTEHHNASIHDPTGQYREGIGTTSYTGMIAVGPDEVMICYDRLVKGWSGGPNDAGELDAVYTIRVRITPT